MTPLNPAAQIFNKHAQSYQERFMDVSLYAESLDIFCRLMFDHAEVLELGCGPGNITKYLLNKRPDLKILGTDLAPQMLELAKINNPTAEFEILDCTELSKIQKKYDGLVAGFCLPYLSGLEAAKLMEDVSKTLKTGGIYYLSTMEENEDHKSGIQTSSSGDQLYMNYYGADDIVSVLYLYGFEILDVTRKETMGAEGKRTTDLLIIARKK